VADDVKVTVTAVDNASTVIGGIQGALLSFNMAMQAATIIQRGFKEAYDASVGTLVTYADSVKTLSIITNTSAESVSRLITVTDRYGVGVGNLETASRKLATQGLSLTLDTVAKLSDEFLTLNSGAERQAFMTQNLGRATQEWAEILSQGSAAILANGAAVQGSLILTQAQLDKTHDYEMRLKDLDQQWKAMKLNAGALTLPIVMKVVTSAVQVTQIADSFQQLSDKTMKSSTSFEDYNKKMYTFIDGLNILEQQALPQTIRGIDTMTEAEYNSAKALSEFNQKAPGYTSALEEIRKGFRNITPVIDTYIKSVSGIASSWQEAGYQALVAQAEMKGAVTRADIIAIDDYAVAMGLMSQAAADAKLQAYDLTTAINSIPKSTDIYITTWYITQDKTMSPSGPPPDSSGKWKWDGHKWVHLAGGGSVGAGDWAMVGDDPTGGITPYTEYVHANPSGGFTVYNQSQMSGQSAPPMAGGGVIGGSGMELSDRALSKLADLFTMALAKNK
jgi:hypothetical protein